jgi:hypothetical protein
MGDFADDMRELEMEERMERVTRRPDWGNLTFEERQRILEEQEQIEDVELDFWYTLQFKEQELRALDELLYYADIELDRRRRRAEAEKNESGMQARYLHRLEREKEHLRTLRNRAWNTL